jgi:ABC-type sugar transport system ATPase subunit
MNILDGSVASASSGKIAVDVESGGKATVPIAGAGAKAGDAVKLGVRPEDLRIAGKGETPIVNGTIDIVEALGEVTLLYVQVEGHEEAVLAKLPGYHQVERGTAISLTADAEQLHLFDSDGQSMARKAEAKEAA